MIVKLKKDDNVEVVLDILFWKTAPGERRIVNGKELIDTTCQININGETSIVSRELTCAVARQNPIDNYNKIVGKKIALARAIANVEFLKPIPQICSINIKRRAMRQHIWNVFYQTFGRWN